MPTYVLVYTSHVHMFGENIVETVSVIISIFYIFVAIIFTLIKKILWSVLKMSTFVKYQVLLSIFFLIQIYKKYIFSSYVQKIISKSDIAYLKVPKDAAATFAIILCVNNIGVINHSSVVANNTRLVWIYLSAILCIQSCFPLDIYVVVKLHQSSNDVMNGLQHSQLLDFEPDKICMFRPYNLNNSI